MNHFSPKLLLKQLMKTVCKNQLATWNLQGRVIIVYYYYYLLCTTHPCISKVITLYVPQAYSTHTSMLLRGGPVDSSPLPPASLCSAAATAQPPDPPPATAEKAPGLSAPTECSHPLRAGLGGSLLAPPGASSCVVALEMLLEFQEHLSLHIYLCTLFQAYFFCEMTILLIMR